MCRKCLTHLRLKESTEKPGPTKTWHTLSQSLLLWEVFCLLLLYCKVKVQRVRCVKAKNLMWLMLFSFTSYEVAPTNIPNILNVFVWQSVFLSSTKRCQTQTLEYQTALIVSNLHLLGQTLHNKKYCEWTTTWDRIKWTIIFKNKCWPTIQGFLSSFFILSFTATKKRGQQTA